MRIKYRVFPLLLSLLLFFLFVSCASDRILPPESESTLESLSVPTEAPLSSGTEETVSQTTASCVTEAPEPELPALSFFLDDLSKNFYVITEYENEWIPGKDLGCFGVIPAIEVDGATSYADYWNRAYGFYPELLSYRIGYQLDYTVITTGEAGQREESHTMTICSPKDTVGDFNQLLEIYLYDDVHQIPGQFYSHLLQEDIDGTTLITSIKLTGGASVARLSKVTLSAFLYAGDADFDAEGNYIGTHITVLPITKLS